MNEIKNLTIDTDGSARIDAEMYPRPDGNVVVTSNMDGSGLDLSILLGRLASVIAENSHCSVDTVLSVAKEASKPKWEKGVPRDG